jgi:AAA family ATP:ADP antiporter
MSLRQRKTTMETRGGDAPQPATPKTPQRTETQTPSSDASADKGALTRLRETVFPIHGKGELTKFLLIGSIKFFIIMALTLTRDTKDTLVVTQCGAEAIAFLKVRMCDV